MGRRTKIGRYYVERRSDGKIIKWVSIGRSLSADRRIHSKTKVTSGYGHQGDISARRKRIVRRTRRSTGAFGFGGAVFSR